MKTTSKKFDITKLFNNKSFVIPFSIICSFIIWLVIVINQNPIRENIFTDVPAVISIENTAASKLGLGIVSNLSNQKFTVTISGPNYIVSSLETNDFILTADITDINAAGTYTLDVIGTRTSNKSGYTFMSISPSTIDVTFDYIDTKNYEIKPKLIGVSAAEGLVAESPIPSNFEQNTITIKGPRSIMKNIDSVGCICEVNKTLASTQSYDCYVVLYDANGNILYRYTLDGKVFNNNDEEIFDRRLTLSYTSLKITQPISKKKNVLVSPEFSNVPSGINLDDLNATVNINSISVIGTPEIIDKMNTLYLTPIDFKNISSGNTSFEIAPNLPEGVKIVDAVDYFVVNIDLKKYSEKTVNISGIKFENLEKGLNAVVNTSIKNVKICGPIDVIMALNEQDIYATVDLTGKKAGDYTLDVTISSNKFNSIWAYGSYSVSVTIR